MTNDQNNTSSAENTAPVKKTTLTGEPIEEKKVQQPSPETKPVSHEHVSATSHNDAAVVEPERAASAILKLLAIVGLIGLLALATWLSVQIIRYTPVALDSVSGVSFSSIFSPGQSDREISFALDTLSYQSGRPFTLAWENGTETVSRDYTFTYSCAPGITFKVLRGTEVIEVDCEEPFEFSTMANQLVVVPSSDSNRFLDTTITLARADDSSITTSATLTLVNEQMEDSPDLLVQNGMRDDDRSVDGEQTDDTTDSTAPAPVPTPSPTTPSSTPSTPAPSAPTHTAPAPQPTQPQTVYVPNPATQSNPAGQPDLAVRIVETGIMTTLGGEERFVALSPIPSDQRAAVRFSVENVGNRTSGDSWYFIATLPLEGDTSFAYRSPRQQALGPTDRIEFTLKFDDITTGEIANVRIAVEGEPNDRVSQNNTTQARLQVTAR